MERSIVTGKAAGIKQGVRASSKSSYVLYDTCDKCPLRVYIDVICNDNLSALIVSGNAPESALLECRSDLVSEFNELSGNGNSSAMVSMIKNIQLYRAQILGFSIAAELLAFGRTDAAFDFLNNNGVSVGGLPETEQEWMKIGRKIESKIRLLRIKIRDESRRQRELADRNNGIRPTIKDFNDQMVALSKHVGFRLTKDISLAEYAGYLKDYKNELNNGSKNTK